MTIMANDSSATVRETPHANQTTRTATIINALKERAQAVLNDRSIDPQSRIQSFSVRFARPRLLNRTDHIL
jgi:hypothetical protein